MKKINVLTQLRSQERPLRFLKGHGGDGVLPLWVWLAKCRALAKFTATEQLPNPILAWYQQQLCQQQLGQAGAATAWVQWLVLNTASSAIT